MIPFEMNSSLETTILTQTYIGDSNLVQSHY